jgi:hypothetical protein
MITAYPRSRVSLIDVSSSFQEGFKKAMAFARKYNIHINTADGRRIVTSFCVESIVNKYNSTRSEFPKATCISKSKVPSTLLFFVESYFNGILKQMPIYYCGICDMSSPDLEYAALNALRQNVSKRDYTDLLAKLKVRKIA